MSRIRGNVRLVSFLGVSILTYINLFFILHDTKLISYSTKEPFTNFCLQAITNSSISNQLIFDARNDLTSLDEEYFKKLNTNETECNKFRNAFPNNFLNEKEINFPLAFTFSIHRDIAHFANLLRVIYRATNVYCIHIDRKASDNYVKAVNSLVQCLDKERIHILDLESRVDVIWACPSNFFCHFNCAKFLVNAQKNSVFSSWRYLINMSGQEFPLRTNLEIVQMLSVLNGKSMIEGLQRNFERFPTETNIPFKGSVYIAGSHEFIKFVVKNETAASIIKTLIDFNNKNGCNNMDEGVYSTLYYNKELGAPGSFNLKPGQEISIEFRVHASWDGKDCYSGKTVRSVCIFGRKDLNHLLTLPAIGVNKFHQDFEPEARDCIQKWIALKVLNENNISTGSYIKGPSIRSIVDKIHQLYDLY